MGRMRGPIFNYELTEDWSSANRVVGSCREGNVITEVYKRGVASRGELGHRGNHVALYFAFCLSFARCRASRAACSFSLSVSFG
jgi:hypothetical protein